MYWHSCIHVDIRQLKINEFCGTISDGCYRICNNLGHTTILGHLLPSTKSKLKSMNNSSFRGTSIIIKFSDFETRALSVCAVSHHFRQKNICVKTIFHLFLLGCCFIWSWFWQAFFPRKNKQNAI